MPSQLFQFQCLLTCFTVNWKPFTFKTVSFNLRRVSFHLIFKFQWCVTYFTLYRKTINVKHKCIEVTAYKSTKNKSRLDLDENVLRSTALAGQWNILQHSRTIWLTVKPAWLVRQLNNSTQKSISRASCNSVKQLKNSTRKSMSQTLWFPVHCHLLETYISDWSQPRW